MAVPYTDTEFPRIKQESYTTVFVAQLHWLRDELLIMSETMSCWRSLLAGLTSDYESIATGAQSTPCGQPEKVETSRVVAKKLGLAGYE